MMFKPMNALRKEYAERRQLRSDRLATEANLGGVAPYTWNMADTSKATVTAPTSSGANTVVGVAAGTTTLNVVDAVGNSASASVVVTAS